MVEVVVGLVRMVVRLQKSNSSSTRAARDEGGREGPPRQVHHGRDAEVGAVAVVSLPVKCFCRMYSNEVTKGNTSQEAQSARKPSVRRRCCVDGNDPFRKDLHLSEAKHSEAAR